MKKLNLAPPMLGVIAGTRALIGVGIGLLLSDRLDRRARTRVGLALLGIGVLSSIPIAIRVFGRRREMANGRTDMRASSIDDNVMAH
jgi:hypothetical protein